MNRPTSTIPENPDKPFLDRIVEAIKKSESAFDCCCLAHTAEVSYRRDWDPSKKGSPQEVAHYAERSAVFGAVADRLEDLMSADKMEQMSVKEARFMHIMWPRYDFNPEHDDAPLRERLRAIRERLNGRLGRRE